MIIYDFALIAHFFTFFKLTLIDICTAVSDYGATCQSIKF